MLCRIDSGAKDSKFPRRIRGGAGKRRVIFAPIDAARIAQILHNPRYAGAFVYGRSRVIQKPNSRRVLTSARGHWQVLKKNAHPGYISWDEFESNEQTLRNNLTEFRRGRSPRGLSKQEGLLQGRVLCGVCGARMQSRFEWRNGQRIHYYTCQESPADRRRPSCRWIAAPEIDAALGTLLLQTVTSTAIHSALSVQDELASRLEKIHAQHRRALEQLRHRAEVKRRRFVNCDPDHRLVADALEADWNEALRQLDALQQEHGHQRQADQLLLDEESRTRLSRLTRDFPLAWNDPCTAPQERTRMLALLIEDVTVIQGDTVTLNVRFRGGRTTSLSVPRPPPTQRASKVLPEVIKELDRLLESHSDSEAATQLNALGYRGWLGHPFTTNRVVTLRQRAGLKSRFERLRARGFLTAQEMARELGLCFGHTLRLAHAGVLPTQRCGKAQRVLFAPPQWRRVHTRPWRIQRLYAASANSGSPVLSGYKNRTEVIYVDPGRSQGQCGPHDAARPLSTSGNPHNGRSWRTSKALNVNMPCVIVRSRSVGQPSAFTSSTTTWVSRESTPTTAMAFNTWSVKSHSATPVSSSGSRSHAWRAITPIGSGSWSCARSPVASSGTRTACMTLRNSTTGSFLV